GAEGAALGAGEFHHGESEQRRRQEERARDDRGHEQAVFRRHGEHDRKRREGDAQDAEDQRGEAADQQRRNARELLAQLDAEELEAGLAERYDVGEHGARRFEHALAHLRASRRPTTRPTAAAMPTAASGWSRTCASSWNPASS